MSRRSLYVDRSPGEVRAVLALDGQPERLVIRRDDDDLRLALGARLAARVASVEPAIATAFLDLGGGAEAVMPFKTEARPQVGQFVEIEIRTEPRRDKRAVARMRGPAEAPPRLLAPPPDPVDQLEVFIADGGCIEGRAAREMADEAETQALAVSHPLAGGGALSIEPTRALVAVDIDVGARKGSEAKRITRQTNLAALPVLARLLRLKALGGLVVIDLVGRGHDASAIIAGARTAFAPDNPGVVIGPVGRFGAMELVIPRRVRPLAELLCDRAGALSPRSLAQRLIRRLEDEGRAQPGARLEARCAPEVALAAAPLGKVLADRLGARFAIRADPGRPRDALEVVRS